MLIPGVSICSLGAAKGHDLLVDETLLHQLATEIQKKGRVICKMGHRTGLSEVLGWVCRPRIVGQKLLGDLELLKSGKSYEFVQDLIANFSHTCGLSAAFSGEQETLKNGQVAARCKPDGLHSVDFVESPASNHSGMFEAKINDDVFHFEARQPVDPPNRQLTLAQRHELPQLLARVRAMEVRLAAGDRRRLTINNDLDAQADNRRGAPEPHAKASVTAHAVTGGIEGAAGIYGVEPLYNHFIGKKPWSKVNPFKDTLKGHGKKLAIGAVVGAAATAPIGAAVEAYRKHRLLAGMRRKAEDGQDGQDRQDNLSGAGVARGAARGAAAGAAAAATVGKGTIKQRLAGIGQDLAHPIQSGLPRKLLVGGIVGGVLTGAAGLAIDKLTADRKKKKTGAVGQMPAPLRTNGETNFASRSSSGLNPGEARDRSLYRVAGFRHTTAEDEYDRASSAFKKAGAAGTVAGGLAGSLKGRPGIGAAIGLLSGVGSVAGIRKLMPPNDYGQRSPAEHQIQSVLPATVGTVAAAILARKKLKQMAANAAKRVTPLFPV